MVMQAKKLKKYKEVQSKIKGFNRSRIFNSDNSQKKLSTNFLSYIFIQIS